MARARATYLSEREKDLLHEKTLEVFEKVGVAYKTPQAIDLLASAGAEVDRDALTAKFTWDIIEPCLKTAPKKVLLAGRRPEDDRALGEWPLHTTTDGIQTYVYDDLTGRRREGTAADLETFVKLGDALSEVDAIWPSPQASDIDPYMLPVKFAELTIRNTSKHVQDEVREPDLVEPILAMYEAAAGAPLTERPYFSVTNCTIAPLQHDAEMTEARAGCPIFVLPMPQMGTTGPMSVLGTSILNMAELLSAVVLFQRAAPGCAIVSAVGSAVAEMRSGLYLSGTPEDGLINLTCIEMSKVYGLRSQGSAVTCDAKACDLQAGAKGMHTGLATALAGADVMLAFGLMDSAQTASLAKTVLDADTVNAIERFLRDNPIDEARARRRHRRDRDRRALPHAQEHEAVLSCRRALAAAALAPGVVRTLRRHSAGEGGLGAGPRADREERRAAAARRRPAARRLADRRLPAEPRVSRPGRTDAAGATPSGGGRAG